MKSIVITFLSILFSLLSLIIRAQNIEELILKAQGFTDVTTIKISKAQVRTSISFSAENGTDTASVTGTRDSAGIANLLFQRIFSKQEELSAAALIIMNERQETRDQNKINAALQAVTGKSYFQIIQEILGDQFKGTYRISQNVPSSDTVITTSYRIAVDSLGQIVEVRNNGTPKPGGKVGTYSILSSNRIQVTGIFASPVVLYWLPSRQRWFSIDRNTNLRKLEANE